MGGSKFVISQEEVWIVWGPHLQLVAKARVILLGTLLFNLWALMPAQDS